jgi:DNA-binding CsgD family transcriptional regulator/tetratricopeptide (TPR) repeat protein
MRNMVWRYSAIDWTYVGADIIDRSNRTYESCMAPRVRGLMNLLERSTELAVLEDKLADVRASGRGSLVLVAGEAGIGKTALLDAFCDGSRGVATVRGGCDALFTPRPLGPFVEIAEEVGGELEDVVAGGAAPADVAQALVHELRRRGPTMVLLEDLHWADEATLDVVRMLARRIDSLPVLLAASYRDDSLGRTHPLRLVLGELPSSRHIVRLTLPPLTPDAVALLAGATEATALHRQTGGNPFFVTEVLAAGGGRQKLPATVREAVLARAARLESPARALLDAVAIVPPRAELSLLEALVDGYPNGLDECLASGMLVSVGDAVAFRHEIARLALEESLLPHVGRELHQRALAALASAAPHDLARLAHHAEAAGDHHAVLRYAPAAGERAAGLGAHREAATHFLRALRFADELPPERRAELLERRSYECYLTDQIEDAIDARRLALEEHGRRGDRLRKGDAHRWLSRLAWFAGDNANAEQEADLAVELLESLPPGRELAMAYSNVAQLRMLAHDHSGAILWGGRAIELAQELGDEDTLAHALNNVGSAELQSGRAEGGEKLERSLQLALDAGLDEHAARAYTNLATISVVRRDYEVADRCLGAGIEFCRERNLDSWSLYMTGWLARAQLDRAQWDAAAAAADSVLSSPRVAAPSRIMPLVVLGRLYARRGDADVWSVLDEAQDLAAATGELQRLVPVAAARAEAQWLGGQDDRVEEETQAALELAVAQGDSWSVGELRTWRHRAGVEDEVSAEALPDAFALELAGEADRAAERWQQLGCPYEAALALAWADSEPALRRSVTELQQLDAPRAAARVARTLRERGVRGVSVGPRTSTRLNPAGLTARELEVLALVSEGLRNRDIAAQLFLSEKTVDHHVSAILRKLDVETRGQAAAEAARLGLDQR